MPIFVNPKDPTETYETGKRGRTPSFLKELPEYIKWYNENIQVKKDEIENKRKQREEALKVKVSNRAKEQLDAHTLKSIERQEKQQTIDNSKLSKRSIKEEVKGLKKWTWRFNDVEIKTSARCVVIANTPMEARVMLNKTFINPVSKTEFDSHWTEVALDESDKEGVYELKDNIWTPRKNK